MILPHPVIIQILKEGVTSLSYLSFFVLMLLAKNLLLMIILNRHPE